MSKRDYFDSRKYLTFHKAVLIISLCSILFTENSTFVRMCLIEDLRAYFPHYSDVIMGATTSQIISLTIVYSTIYSGADQKFYQKTSKHRVTGDRWTPRTNGSNAENVSIWWRHHV